MNESLKLWCNNIKKVKLLFLNTFSPLESSSEMKLPIPNLHETQLTSATINRKRKREVHICKEAGCDTRTSSSYPRQKAASRRARACTWNLYFKNYTATLIYRGISRITWLKQMPKRQQ